MRNCLEFPDLHATFLFFSNLVVHIKCFLLKIGHTLPYLTMLQSNKSRVINATQTNFSRQHPSYLV